MPDKYRGRIQPKASKPKKGQIPFGADNYKKPTEEVDKRFTVGYEFYRFDLCELENTPASPLRKSIQDFKKFCSCTDTQQLYEQSIKIKNVINKDHYSKFFKNLDDDVELKEFIVGDSARGMFFIDSSKKIVQMVAHINSHTPTGKNKK